MSPAVFSTQASPPNSAVSWTATNAANSRFTAVSGSSQTVLRTPTLISGATGSTTGRDATSTTAASSAANSTNRKIRSGRDSAQSGAVISRST